VPYAHVDSAFAMLWPPIPAGRTAGEAGADLERSSPRVRVVSSGLRSSEDLFPRPTPHQNLVRIKTAIQPAILRLFMFMVLYCNGVATVYSFILNIDINF
jgi:hypothetical protein